MYEAFYGLSEKPFNLTPDPRFLYLSSKHKEAFAHLLYGIRNRSGFVMVSGEIGTGKTTICRSLLKQLDPDTEVAFIFNPKLSPIELLKTINADFGIESRADTIRGLIDELNAHLLDRAGKGKNCVLIIDEAQNLGTETLEQIRLLSNLETETEKLLQIVLIGQPELADKLALNELRQLNQRITARYHLRSLSGDETLHYIAFRLRVAGGQKKVRFTRSAVRRVFRASRGTPRVINAICDRALLIGYTKEARTITPRIVQQAAREIQGSVGRGRAPNLRLWPASGLAVAALALVAALFVRGDISVPFRMPAGGISAPGADARSASAADAPQADALESAAPAETPAVQPASESPRNIAEAAILPPSDSVLPDPKSGDPAIGALASVPGGAGPGGMNIVETSPTVHRGVEELVRAWNRAVIQSAPTKITQQSVERFATANKLRLLVLDPSVEEMVALGLPALIRMKTGEWSAVLRVEDGEARLVGPAGEASSVTLEDLRSQYAGEAYYFWKDPKPSVGLLRVSSRGEAVEGLQRDLQQLGLLERDPNGIYDATTIDTVTKIQRTTGLPADGIAGPQTRMVLASWLGAPDTPRLSSDGFTDGLRARVLASQGIVTRTREADAAPAPPAQEPAPLPAAEAIEPAPEPETAPAQPDTAQPDAGPTTAPENYTPILPGNAPDQQPPVTPSAAPGSPIRPSGERESLNR